MSDLTPADVLDKAADVIDRNGLAKGEFYDYHFELSPEDCPVCTMGAIRVAAGFHPMGELEGSPGNVALDAMLTFAHRDAVLGPYHPSEVNSEGDTITVIGGWNDEPTRTAEQVMTELRACAADLRQGAGQ